MPVPLMKPDPVPSLPHTVTKICVTQVVCPTPTTNAITAGTVFAAKEEPKPTPPGQLAVQLLSVAIEGLTDEELSDSGGEGMYRERDEFVVRNEDIETLKVGAHIHNNQTFIVFFVLLLQSSAWCLVSR